MDGWKIDAWRAARRTAPTGAPILDERIGLQLVALTSASVRVLTRGVGHKVVVLCVDPPNVIEHYLPLVKILESHARVVCLELPGTGWSLAKEGFRFSMDDHVRVVSELLDKLHVGKATFAFPCLTAFVALAVARKRPDLVGRFVIAQGAGYHEAVKWTRRFDGVGLLRVPIAGQVAAWAGRKTLLKLFYKSTTPEEGSADEPLAMAQDAAGRGADWCCATDFQALQVLDGRKIAGVDLPAVLVWGEGDPSHRKTDRESMRRHLPQAQVVHFWGSGHFPDLDDPVRFAEHVLGIEIVKEEMSAESPALEPLSSLEAAIFSEDSAAPVPDAAEPRQPLYTGETTVSVPDPVPAAVAPSIAAPPPLPTPVFAPPAPPVFVQPAVAPPAFAPPAPPVFVQPVVAPPAFAPPAPPAPPASPPAPPPQRATVAPVAIAPPWASAPPVAPAPRARAPAPEMETLELDVPRMVRRPAPSQSGRRPLANPRAKVKKKRARQGVVSTGARLFVGVGIFGAVLIAVDASAHWSTGLQALIASLPGLLYEPRTFALALTATLAAPSLMWLLRALDLLFPGERGLLAILASAIFGVACIVASFLVAIAISCVLVRLASSPLPLADAIRSFRGAGIRDAWQQSIPLFVEAWRAIVGAGAGLGIMCAILSPRRP